MQYKQLSTDSIDDTVAANMHAREVEHYHYQLNIDNYMHMCQGLDPSDEQYIVLRGRVDAERAQQAMCEAVYQALGAQITDQDAHARAVERVRIKREAAEAKLG